MLGTIDRMLLGLTVSMTFIGVSADGRIENYLAFSEQVCDTAEISHDLAGVVMLG